MTPSPQADPTSRNNPAAATQEQQLQQRVEELSVLYEMSMLLSAHRSVQEILDTAARSAGEALNAKAASIRLLSDDRQELIPRAVYNLSGEYLAKGPVRVEDAELSRRALKGEVLYVEDVGADPRNIYADDAAREGLVSSLIAGIVYQGRPIGTIRLYSGQRREFTPWEINLLEAIAQLLAAAIVNARLFVEHEESRAVQRQLQLASAVQRRMIPTRMPELPGVDVAAQYLSTLELGGDFYDFITLDGHIGIALGDVVGKGIAASLLMSHVRASLRAYAQDVYDIDEVIARVNGALTRDTLDNEFATLFYGVLDPETKKLTYCNAGHEPPLLLRAGEIHRLDIGGLIVGVDAQQEYEKAALNLEPGDMLLIYSDGLSEAKNFNNEQFGRARIIEAMHQAAELPTAKAALKHILWQMRCFTGLARNLDDTTTVLLKVE